MSRRIVPAMAVVLLFATSASADMPRPSGTKSAAERAASTPAYADGRRDRKAWENWFNGLAIGSYRDGAFWWFGERSKASPDGCASSSGDAEWIAGCRAAQQRLALPDVRWKTETFYALGWLEEVSTDMPPEPITMADAERIASLRPGYSDGWHDREAWEEWLKRLPIGSYRDGSLWWLDEHSKQRPQACESPTGDSQWQAGCRAAQSRLAVPDVRRTTEVDYRLGWNSEVATPPPR
jgi:hypothetical protein